MGFLVQSELDGGVCSLRKVKLFYVACVAEQYEVQHYLTAVDTQNC
jgi:hypothetical protein